MKLPLVDQKEADGASLWYIVSTFWNNPLLLIMFVATWLAIRWDMPDAYNGPYERAVERERKQ